MKHRYLYLILIFSFSCDDQLLRTSPLEGQDSEILLPLLEGANTPNQLYTASEIVYTRNQFVGVGDLNRTNFLVNDNPNYQDNYYLADDLEPKNDANIRIIIDTSQIITIDEYQLPEDFYENLKLEDFYGGNFEGLLNQHPLNRYKSLPVFVINKSSSHNTLSLDDGTLPMIYEALDSSGNWLPIEYKTYSWCGNSYSSLNIQKDQYALFKVPEQSGNFDTRLRLKARIGGYVIYSNEISGSINESQFILNNKSSPFDWHYEISSQKMASLFLNE